MLPIAVSIGTEPGYRAIGGSGDRPVLAFSGFFPDETVSMIVYRLDDARTRGTHVATTTLQAGEYGRGVLRLDAHGAPQGACFVARAFARGTFLPEVGDLDSSFCPETD